MALDRKLAALLSLSPDIAIVPECAEPERLRRKAPGHACAGAVWAGDNPNKGLAVFPGEGTEFVRHALHDPAHKVFLPLEVRRPVPFNLLAVWSFNDRGQKARTDGRGAFLRALDAYAPFCRERPLIVAGDFNNNVQWDRPNGPNNHASIVEALADHGLVSAYHEARGIAFGLEPEATHYWRDRRKDGPRYHIDYVFLPQAWMNRVRKVNVGSFEEWCGNGLSDHVPVVVDIDLP